MSTQHPSRRLARTVALALAVSSPTLVAGEAYTVTTPGKPGSGELVPALAGTGPATPGSTTNALVLSDALPAAPTTFVVGFAELAAPFKGGVLGPTPDALVAGLSTDGAGGLELPFTLPIDAPVGLALWLQAGVTDAGATAGLALSNTLRLDVHDAPLCAPLYPAARYATLPFGSSVTTNDFDGDGVTDVVIGHAVADDITFLRGLGGGRFAASVFIQTSAARAITSYDVDADGHVDLVAARPFFGGLAVHPGLGDGSFGAPTLYPIGANPTSIAVADLDADGLSDLVVANGDSDDVSVLIGQAGGGFASAGRLAVGDSPVEVVVGDVDGDGHLDLAVANAISKDVSVLLGDGRGGFAPALTTSVEVFPKTLRLGDLDGDANLDLVAAVGNASGLLAVRLGVGDGTFGPLAAYPAVTADLELLDADGDGHLDAFTSGSGVTRVLLGDGQGAFGPASIDHFTTPGTTPAVFVDVNEDGEFDLVTFVNLQAEIALSRGDGTYVELATGLTDGGELSAAVGDVDGDGAPELVVANADTDSFEVFSALDVTGPLATGVTHAASEAPADVALADVDGDGASDVLLADRTATGLTLVPSDGAGGFGPPAAFDALGPSSKLVAADVDGDSHVDAVVANTASPRLAVLLGDGLGGFAPAIALTLPAPATDVATGDVDGDGRLDVAVSVGPDVRVYLGRGDGTFAPGGVLTPSLPPGVLTVADLDGDGHDDVVATSGSGFVGVALGGPAGSLTPTPTVFVGGSLPSLAATDVDGDGLVDVVTGDSDGTIVLRGLGDGSFAPAQRFGSATSPLVSVVDIDGDETSDVVAVSRFFGGIAVLPNQR